MTMPFYGLTLRNHLNPESPNLNYVDQLPPRKPPTFTLLQSMDNQAVLIWSMKESKPQRERTRASTHGLTRTPKT